MIECEFVTPLKFCWLLMCPTECGFWLILEWGWLDFVCCSTYFLCRFGTESPVFLGPMFVTTRNTFLMCHFLMFYVIVIQFSLVLDI
jgi:hypothetical protein